MRNEDVVAVLGAAGADGNETADWQVVCTGTISYAVSYYAGSALWPNHAATLYEDVNHPGNYKIEPWGDAALMIKADASLNYVVDNQTVGSTEDSQPINAADWNVDQEDSDPSICYYDEDDEAYYFLLIYRKGGPRGSGSILCYGYDAFIPAIR